MYKRQVNNVIKIPKNEMYFLIYTGVEIVIVQKSNTRVVNTNARVGPIAKKLKLNISEIPFNLHP